MAKTKSKTPAKRNVPPRDDLVWIATELIDMLKTTELKSAKHACLSIDFEHGTISLDACAG